MFQLALYIVDSLLPFGIMTVLLLWIVTCLVYNVEKLSDIFSDLAGCLAFIGISRPYFAITNKTRVQGNKIRNKFKN